MPRDEPALKDQDVNHHANDHTPDERSEEITAGFPAGFVGEFDASAATGTEAGEWAVEELPTDSALLVVTRGPNAGSRFLLDQPITSAGRHPGSDIFLDDITVSRRHAEFRRDDGQFQIVDIGKRFAHFFFISGIVDEEPPDRILYFTRLGNTGDSFKAKHGAVGLEWRDDEVVRQYRHEDNITERELRETLAELKSLIEWCGALKVLAMKVSDSPDLPDNHTINTEDWLIPWRTDAEPLLLLGDLRLSDEECEPASLRDARSKWSAMLAQLRRCARAIARQRAL